MFCQRADIFHPVTDPGVHMGFAMLNLVPVWKLQWWWERSGPGKWGLWLMVVQISFLKCDVLSQFQDGYSKVLLSLLMTSSFKVNKLYSLPSRFAEQKARHGGKGAECFLQQSTGNHRPLAATSPVLLSGRLKKFTAQPVSFQPASDRAIRTHKWQLFCKPPFLWLWPRLTKWRQFPV